MKAITITITALVTSVILALPAASFLIDWKIKSFGTNTQHWRYSTSLGNYGNSILLRAAVARAGLGAHTPEEALYYTTGSDRQGKPLVGTKKYRIHMEKEHFPSVTAFWSFTVVKSANFMLVDNSIHRYSLGDRTQGVKYNNDGSLDVYLQHTPPQASLRTNWLPTPPDGFIVVLRAYEPTSQMLQGAYKPPAIEEVA